MPSTSLHGLPGKGVGGSPPAAPTSVVATAFNGAVQVSWAQSVDPGPPILDYVAWVASGTPGTAQYVRAPANGVTVTGLRNGTAYTFVVFARSQVGPSAPSAASNVVTPVGPPLAAPTGVSVVPATNTAQVSFTAVDSANNGGAAIDAYRVTVYITGVAQTATSSGAASPVTATGLQTDTTYTATVAAHNSAGYGPESAPTTAFTPTGGAAQAPGQVTGVVVTAGVSSLTVSWTPPPDGGSAILDYTVSWDSGGTAVVTAPNTAFTITGLVNGVTYAVTVTARNAIGTGPTSVGVQGTPLAGRIVGTAMAASLTPSGELDLVMPAGLQAGDLILVGVASDTGDPRLVPAGYLDLGAAPIADTLNMDVFYRFATDTSDSGATVRLVVPAVPGPVVTQVTPPPSTPTNVSAVAGNAQATVSWSASTGNPTSYTVTTFTGGNAQSGTVTVTPPALSATITGLVNGTSYTFAVRANSSGGASALSAQSNAVTPAAAGAAGNRARVVEGVHVDGVPTYSNGYVPGVNHVNAGNIPWWMQEQTGSIAATFNGQFVDAFKSNAWDPFNNGATNFSNAPFVPNYLFSLYGSYDDQITPRHYSCRDVANGLVDGEFDYLINQINTATRLPFIAFRPGWEVDGGWFRWANDATAADFVAMFRHIHDYFNAHLNLAAQGKVWWEWNAFSNTSYRGSDPNGYKAKGSGGSAPYSTYDYYPGDAYVDIIGCDNYEISTVAEGNIIPPMQAAAAFAKSGLPGISAGGKMVGYSEVGLWDNVQNNGQILMSGAQESNGRSQRVVQSVLNLLDSLPAAGQAGALAYFMWFDAAAQGGIYDWSNYPLALNNVYRPRMLRP